MPMRTRHFLLITVVALVMAGCVGSGGIPQEHFYRLPQLSPTTSHQAPPPSLALSVPRLRATGLLHERALLYSDSKQPQDIRSYHYLQWQDPPGILVRDHLITYLRDSGLSPRIIAPASGARAELKLVGKLIRMEQVTTGEGVTAVVEVEFSLLRGGQTLFGPERYQSEAASGSRSPSTTVNAFGSALKNVYDDLITDLVRNAASR